MAVGRKLNTMLGDPRAGSALRAALRRRLRAYLEQKRMQEQSDIGQGALGLGQLLAFQRQQRRRLPGDEMSQSERNAARALALSRVLRGVYGPYTRPMNAPRPGPLTGEVEAGGRGYEVDGRSAIPYDPDAYESAYPEGYIPRPEDDEFDDLFR